MRVPIWIVGATLLTAASAQAQRPLRCDPMNDCLPVPTVPAVRATPQVLRASTQVRAQLQRGVLRWEVTETFVNRGGGAGEADYLFPLPADAAFDDLKLSINGELVAGEILSADRARAVYEEIVRRQRDPALVEWIGRGLVRTRIFPIAPGEEKRVVLRYTQPARREGDALRVDWRPPRGARGGARVAEAPTSFTFDWDGIEGLGTPYSPTHELRPVAASERRVTANAGDADLTLLVPMRAGREPAVTMLTHAPAGDGRWAMIALTPPAERAARQPRDVTFVLDVSGSMAGRKLEQAKAAGRQLLASLTPGDRVRLIAFSTDVQTWRDGFVPVTSANRDAGGEWLDALTATGSTNISGALHDALRGGGESGALPLVLFVTDGEPTVGLRAPEVIADSARAWRGDRRVFTFGVGADVNAALVERLAVEGRGTAQFVRPAESVERAVAVTAARLAAPIVRDLQVRATGVRLVRVHPELPQDVFAGQDVVLFAQVEGSGDATLEFTGQGRDGAVRWTQRVQVPAQEPANGFVGKLWATQRVGWLSAERRRHGASTELDDELRALGTRWGIPTELTSYLVLEPGMRPDRVVNTGGPAAPAEARFEMARSAAQMRDAKSLASVQDVVMPAATASDAPRRTIGSRVLALRDGVWTDVAIPARDRLRVVRVAPYSAAWFALAKESPSLAALFAAGDAVRVAGRAVIIETAADGVTALDASAVTTLVRQFGG
ncbi:MAG: VIT and VWA domain-containing protein [Gemmatimonadaceae bacterium]|nr:VIT and VWA domain-containing protein [Gemmatimonadaceae bacterium]